MLQASRPTSAPALTTPPRPFRRQVMLNTAWSGASNAWAMAVGFLAVPALLGGLGSAGFGAWVLLQTFSATNGWMSLADIGVVVTTTRKVGSSAALCDSDRVARLTSAAVATCAGLGAVAAILLASVGTVVLPFVFRIPDDLITQMRAATVVFSVQIVFDQVINAAEGVLEGLQRVDTSRAVDIVRRTVVTGSAAVVAMVTGDLVATFTASVLACGSVMVGSLVVLHRRVPDWFRRPEGAQVRSLIREGRDVALVRPLGVIRRTMDRVIAGVLLGPSAVTLVEIATQLQAGADAVLSSTSYAVVPASAWVGAREDRSALGELAERGSRYSMLATLPFVVAIAMLAGPVVDLWVGTSYSDAAALTTVAVAAVGVLSTVAIGSQLLLGLGMTRPILRTAVVALLLNLALSLALVKVVGVVGVFIGTLISSLVEVPLLGPSILRAAGVSAVEWTRTVVLPVVPPLVAQLVLTGLVLVTDLSPLWTVVAGGAIGFLGFAGVARLTAISGAEIRTLRAELRTS